MQSMNKHRAVSEAMYDPLQMGAGHVGFSLPGGGGGGVNRAPQNWGGGVREKSSIDGHH